MSRETSQTTPEASTLLCPSVASICFKQAYFCQNMDKYTDGPTSSVWLIYSTTASALTLFTRTHSTAAGVTDQTTARLFITQNNHMTLGWAGEQWRKIVGDIISRYMTVQRMTHNIYSLTEEEDIERMKVQTISTF